MSYGLTTCGLTAAGHKTLETLVVRQLRAILRLPAHLTQTTNQEVALQAGILLPSEALSAMLQREAQRRAHCQDHHVALPTGAWWKHVHASLRPTPEQDSLSLVASTATPQVCPVCGVSYATRTALLTHMAKQHAAEYPTSCPEPFDKTLDAIGGLPQCSHCQKKFATWQLLQRHVEGNYCAVRHSFLPQPPADPVPPSMDRPPLFPESPIQDCISKYSSNAVYYLPDRHRYRQHCMLCGQWIASSKVMKLHYRQSHSDLTNSYEQSATKMCQSYTTGGTPCQYCGAHLSNRRPIKQSAQSSGNSALISLVPSELWMEMAAEQDVDIAVETVFGNLARDSAQSFAAALLEPSQTESERPPKAAKVELGKRGRPSDNSNSGGRSDKGQGKGGHKAQPQMAALVKAMGKLIIRQETQLQILKQNSAWQVYLQPGTAGPIPVLFKAAEAYEEQAKTKFMEAPVRAVLLRTLFQTLLHCLQALSTNVAQQNMVQSKGWMNADGSWSYQRWDSDSQSLKVDEARTPVPHQELVTLIAKLADLVVVRDVIHRFNAIHPISVDKESTSHFKLEVGLRAKGVEDTWNGLEKITNLAALQLVGMQIRREGLKREGLANEVQKLLHSY